MLEVPPNDQIQKSATQVKLASDIDHPSTPAEIKKPLISQGLEDGAGEEGRTPDLMLGKHGKKKSRA